jgi:diguanylate cyclase (GGDEF)-like protein
VTTTAPGVTTLPPWRRVVAVGLVVAVGVASTAALLWRNHRDAEDRALQRTMELVGRAAADLQRGVDRSDEIVAGIANMMSTFGPPDPRGGGVGEEQFAQYADPRLTEHPELQALQYQTWITDAERDQLEALLAAGGHRNGIVEPTDGSELRTAPSRDQYLVILYTRPDTPNLAVFGLDVLARPATAELIDEIAASGSLGVAESTAIVQGGGEVFAMPLYRPVYDASMPLGTPEQRRAAFRGVSAAVLRYRELVAAALGDFDQEADLRVVDVVGGEDAVLLATDGDRLVDRDEIPASLPPGTDPERSTVVETVRLGDRDLRLVATPRPSLVDDYEDPARSVILIAGLLVTITAAAAWWRWSQARRLHKVAVALTQANAQLQAGSRHALHLARTDLLTGVANRDYLCATIDERVTAAQPTALLLVDLDRFKVVNDSFGHRHGDDLLRAVATRLRSMTTRGDLVARVGSDVFAVMAGGPLSQPLLDADRLLAGLARPYSVGDRQVHLSATVGVCRYPDGADSGAELMLNADVALHEAKRTDRGHWLAYDASMARRAARREWLERELFAALEADDGALTAYYQCRVDLHSGEIVGAEALARWNHPEVGPVSPAEFIPVAEETGLIMGLGALVLRETCEVIARCLDAGAPVRCIALNVSGQQLREGGFARAVRVELDRAEVPATMLVVEVTETVAMDDDADDAAVARQLQALRDLGVTISIDDFGTGYSSMSRLAELPVQELKIDQSFVAGLPDNHAQAGIVGAVLSMAHHLGLVVVAEGVESADQLTWLRSHGCEEAQGWLFSRAVPADAFLAQLRPRSGAPPHWPPVGRQVSEWRRGRFRSERP